MVRCSALPVSCSMLTSRPIRKRRPRNWSPSCSSSHGIPSSGPIEMQHEVGVRRAGELLLQERRQQIHVDGLPGLHELRQQSAVAGVGAHEQRQDLARAISHQPRVERADARGLDRALQHGALLEGRDPDRILRLPQDLQRHLLFRRAHGSIQAQRRASTTAGECARCSVGAGEGCGRDAGRGWRATAGRRTARRGRLSRPRAWSACRSPDRKRGPCRPDRRAARPARSLRDGWPAARRPSARSRRR